MKDWVKTELDQHHYFFHFSITHYSDFLSLHNSMFSVPFGADRNSYLKSRASIDIALDRDLSVMV